jgi:hypothetical protein
MSSSLSDAEARFSAAKERLLSLIKSSVDRTEGGPSLDLSSTSVVNPTLERSLSETVHTIPSMGVSSLQQFAQDFHATAGGRDDKSRISSGRRMGGEISHSIPAAELRQIAASLPLLQPVNPNHHTHNRVGLTTAPHGGSIQRDRSTSDGSGGGNSDIESASTHKGVQSGNKKKGKSTSKSSLATSTTIKSVPKDFDLRLGPAYQADIDKMREKSEVEWEKRRQEAHARMQMLSLSRDGKSFHIHLPNQSNNSLASYNSTHSGSARTKSRGNYSKGEESTTYASYSARNGSGSGIGVSASIHYPSTPMSTSSTSGNFGSFAFPAALTTGINVGINNSILDKTSSSSASAVLFQQRQQLGVAFHQSSASSGMDNGEKFPSSMQPINTPSFPPSLVIPHINLSRSQKSSSTVSSAPHSPTIPTPTLAQQQQHLYQSQQALFEQQHNALQRLYLSGSESSRSSSPSSSQTKSTRGDSPERQEEIARAVYTQQLLLQQMQVQQFSTMHQLQQQQQQQQQQSQSVLPPLKSQQTVYQQDVRDPRSVRMQIDSALAHSKPNLPPSSPRTSPTRDMMPSFETSSNYAATNPLKVGNYAVNTSSAPLMSLSQTVKSETYSTSPSSRILPPHTPSFDTQKQTISSVNEVKEGTNIPLSPRGLQIDVKYGLSVFDSHRAALESSSSTSIVTSPVKTLVLEPLKQLENSIDNNYTVQETSPISLTIFTTEVPFISSNSKQEQVHPLVVDIDSVNLDKTFKTEQVLPLSPILPNTEKGYDYSTTVITTPFSQVETLAINDVGSAKSEQDGGVDLNYSNFSPGMGVGGGLDDYVEEMRKQLVRQQMLVRGIHNLPQEIDDLGEEDVDEDDENEETDEEHNGNESLEELRSELQAAQAEIQMKNSTSTHSIAS